ncbi:hypothetical protein ASD44_11055 [Mesorhizobium sp. Root554]|uniref:anti-sigma factor n=1 Tax=unclassified Mesorhizobium TaxID=325217 RepID=UPI0006F84FA8|nr:MULTISPECIES: anti-sigma factor [unclassified Mesorhizobium]KQZ14550.1 hypothetical protein ASD27_11065 [Mesorhizobium sp. Root1471]KQZ37057.1 hypothetical protein ASD44_11055 [Mesorhizobium sp. Root554]
MTDNEQRMARAGDYVLGLMSEEERDRAEHDMERDAAFRDAVLTAAQHFHKLDLTTAPEPVPDQLWQKVSERIASLPQMQAAETAPASPSKPRVAANARPKRFGLHSLGGRGGFAIAASLAAACAIGYFGALATVTNPQPVVVVVLDTPANTPGAIFEAFADDSVRIVPLEEFTVPAGQTMQVWTLYDKAVGPVSLGTIGAKATEVRLQGPHLPLPKPEQLYEITLEPSPGSPTGKPTGPILVKGFARQPARS